MKRKQHITAFYLETLLMIVVFISIILVLTRVFGSARAQSVEARDLTAAVTLAQNTAEAASASHSPQDLQAILEEGGNTLVLEGGSSGGPDENGALVVALYDAEMQPLPISGEVEESIRARYRDGDKVILPGSGALLAEAGWRPAAEEDREGLVDVEITVYNAESGKAVYSLNTSLYLP